LLKSFDGKSNGAPTILRGRVNDEGNNPAGTRILTTEKSDRGAFADHKLRQARFISLSWSFV
jgi:hypothetical protein